MKHERVRRENKKINRAAYDAGLDFVGYEIDKTYFEKQEERFAKHTAQQNLFLMDEQESIF